MKLMIIIGCAVLVAIYAIVCNGQWQSLISENTAQCESLSREADYYNNLYRLEMQEKLANSQNEEEVPLYTDGKIALGTAYQAMLNSKSVYATIKGKSTTRAAGLNIEIFIDNINIKYSEGVYASVSCGYVPIMTSQNTSSQKYCVDDKVVVRSTSTLINNNGKLSGVFSNAFMLTNSEVETIPLVDAINIKTDGISTINSFKIVRDSITNKILRYEVDAVLNPKKGIDRYAKSIQMGAGLEKNPEFKNITVKATISHTGRLLSMTTDETYSIVKPILGGINADLRTVLSYNFSQYDEDIAPLSFIKEAQLLIK